MKITAMYWSATGTTQKVVRAIAQELDAQYETFDFTLPAARAQGKAFGPDDVVVFSTPVYAGRVPNVLLKYLATVQGLSLIHIYRFFGIRSPQSGGILRPYPHLFGKTALAGAVSYTHLFSIPSIGSRRCC